MKMRRYGVRPINRPTFALAEGGTKSVSAEDTNMLLNKVKAIYSGASGAAKSFFEYVRKTFGIVISKIGGFVNVLKLLCAGAAGVGAGRYLGSAFSGAVSYANALIFRLKLKPELSGKFSEFFKMADKKIPLAVLTASIISFSLYRVYKVLINDVASDIKVKESVKLSFKSLAIQKSILESTVLFDKSTRIVKSDLFTEADAGSVVSGLITKASKKCKEMYDDIVKRGATVIKKHQGVITAILLCIGFVSAFMPIGFISQAADFVNKNL